MSWVLNLDKGYVQVRDAHRGNGDGSSPTLVHKGELARTLLSSLKSTPALRALQVLPVADGTLHDFLLIGFPISDALPQPQVAGVAIDITQHKLRVAELAQQALVDELTGLYNLRGFQLFAEHELKVARRRGTQCAVVYVDVDGLKKINDAHGHQCGSDVLVTTAKLLRQVFRECDVIARLGGDEFAVFAAEVKGDSGLLRERLRHAVAKLGMLDGLAPSVSVGVGSSPPDRGLQLQDLLAVADQAMYRDKSSKAQRVNGALSSSGDSPS